MKLINKFAILLAILTGIIACQQTQINQIKTEIQGIESFITQWSE